MPDREKLTALLKDAETAYDKFIHETSVMPNKAAFFAEYLIDHGVTFATDNNVGDKWIPVTERLPKVGADILVCHKNGLVTTNAWLGTHWWFKDDKNTITHWMPLPEPPKEGE